MSSTAPIPPYPVMLDLRGRHVLLVGGGGVALRKASAVLESGARITVVSPAFAPEFLELEVERLTAAYGAEHLTLHPFTLVFAATSDAGVNGRVRSDAAARGMLCCRCDSAGDSDFWGAATARVGGITIAVSTASHSPTIAAQVRDRLAASLDPAWQSLADLLPAWRARARAEVTADGARHLLLRQVASEEMLEVLRSQGPAGAHARFESLLLAARGTPPSGRSVQ